jgi:hypothetical protein
VAAIDILQFVTCYSVKLYCYSLFRGGQNSSFHASNLNAATSCMYNLLFSENIQAAGNMVPCDIFLLAQYS